MRPVKTFMVAVLDTSAAMGIGLAMIGQKHELASRNFPVALWHSKFSLPELLLFLTSMLACRLALRVANPDRDWHKWIVLVLGLAQVAGASLLTAFLLDCAESRLEEQRSHHKFSLLIAGVLFTYQLTRLLLFSSHLPWSKVEVSKVLILGTGKRAMSAWREIRTRDSRIRTVIGFVSDRPLEYIPGDIADRCVCCVDTLSEYLLGNVVDELIVALPLRSCYDIAQRAVSAANNAGIESLVLTDTFFLPHGRLERLHAPAFVHLSPTDSSFLLAASLKRALDIVGSLVGIILLLPVFLLTAAAVRLTSDGPALFVQARFGHRRRIFNMYKFRSMVRDAPALMAQLESLNEADGPIFKIANDPRITAVGRFIRRTSLDELPQLFNVLKGDMSLVGPRPMSLRDVALFTDAQLMRRFCAKPGMTGIWQVAGRSSAGFDQWIKHDFHYLDNWSLAMDIRILARTIPAVLKRSGAV